MAAPENDEGRQEQREEGAPELDGDDVVANAAEEGGDGFGLKSAPDAVDSGPVGGEVKAVRLGLKLLNLRVSGFEHCCEL
jgi:hypothetical protein